MKVYGDPRQINVITNPGGDYYWEGGQPNQNYVELKINHYGVGVKSQVTSCDLNNIHSKMFAEASPTMLVESEHKFIGIPRSRMEGIITSGNHGSTSHVE